MTERKHPPGTPAARTRIVWSQATALGIAQPIGDVLSSFHAAQDAGEWVALTADGRRVSVNPARVLYLEALGRPT